METRTSPSWTTSPSATLTAATVPACSASTGISIFMDSSSTTVSPARTGSPAATGTLMTLATISATTSTLLGARAMAATLLEPAVEQRRVLRAGLDQVVGLYRRGEHQVAVP